MSSGKKLKHSIYFDSSRCMGDMDCLKICPVEAIRIRNGKAVMLEDKCIDCGECVKICKSGAIISLTNTFNDFSNYKYIVAVPSIILYTQFDRNVKPKTILSSLEKIGFDEVFDITRICNTVAKALKNYLKEHLEKKPLISSFCPTCVKIIQMLYPELKDNLVPIISPIELAAKYVKNDVSKRLNLKKEEIGVIYITPCPSKMILISRKSENYFSDFDGAIPIYEIYNTLYGSVHQMMKEMTIETGYYDISGYGLHFAESDGLKYMMDNDNCISVSGINNVIHILDEIDKGKLSNVDFVEMNSCPEGCLGGPMVVENAYIARTNLKNLINYYRETRIPIAKKDEFAGLEFYNPSIIDTFEESKNEVNIRSALQKLTKKKQIYAGLPKINCTACGAPGCEAFAEDVAAGYAEISDCVILENRKLKNKLDNLKFNTPWDSDLKDINNL